MKRQNDPADKVRLRRGHHLGHYDRETVNAILDSGFLAHVGYVDDGAPLVTPMLYWRDGDYVYWHGSTASRAMKSVVNREVCMSVTHLDGLVLAKSAFHHSANYRSVMLFGTAEAILDRDEKIEHLRVFMEQRFPGRWDQLRPVKEKELKGTLIVRMKIDQYAAKIRTGPPSVDAEDKSVPVWIGELPLLHQFGAALSCEDDTVGASIPQNILQHVGHVL